MLKDVYLGNWDSLDDMLHSFQVGKQVVKGYKVIVAAYYYGDYDGSAFVLLKKGHKYYEVNGSHCSCYGLEGQFDIEESAKLALKHRYSKGESYGVYHNSEVGEVLKQHFGW